MYSMFPFILKVKNTSDDKIYNVDLLSKKDDRVLIEYGWENISFPDFKRYFQDKLIIIGNTKIKAFHDFKRYVDKQLSCSLTINNINESNVFRLDVDPGQFQSNQVVFTRYYNIDSTTQLILEHLMPEMELYIYLYPKLIQ